VGTKDGASPEGAHEEENMQTDRYGISSERDGQSSGWGSAKG
jgi:hypothetical protein